MKTSITDSLKTLLADRILAVMLLFFILICIAYCIFVGLSLHPSDLQVAIHYSAFGDTNFYRAKWYYLISFILFGIIIAVTHTALTAKLYLQGRRPLALLFLGFSFLLIAIAWFFARSVLGIAFL